MASIISHKGNLYLSIYLDGKRYKRSLQLKDTLENRKKAEDKLPSLERDIKRGKVSLDKTPSNKHMKTFLYYSNIYINSKQKELKNSTFYKYQLIIQKFNEFFGDMDINSIKVSVLKSHLDSYDVGAKTLREYIIVLKGIFDEAFFDEEIKENPVKYIRKAKMDKPEINPFYKDEVNLLIQNSSGWFKNYLGIAFYTGMRTGELLALKWENIDFYRKEIDIKLSRNEHGETTPKTAGSIRTIPMFDKVEYFLNQQKLKTGFKNQGYVFLNQYNNPFTNSDSLVRHYWQPLLKHLGLKYRRLYETRHTFATMMLEYSDFTPLEIANFLGHSSSQMIFNRYSKFVQHKGRKIDLKFDVFGLTLVSPKKSSFEKPIKSG